LQRILNPTSPARAANLVCRRRSGNLKKLDTLTVQFNLKTPDSLFAQRWGSASTNIVPTGYDPANPVGTGRSRCRALRRARAASLVRNPNYWMSGEPYLNEVEIIDFSDNTSRVAALLSGQVDAIDGVDPST